LKEVDKEAAKVTRKIKVLLQVHIAEEEHKFGFSYGEIDELLKNKMDEPFPNILITGLMGMATFTDEKGKIRNEFNRLSAFFKKVKTEYFPETDSFCELSMGMSDDYPIAIEEGSTIVRIGSKIFGTRG
jgi:pyridoxal phosphate enzyme (YggS family)